MAEHGAHSEVGAVARGTRRVLLIQLILVLVLIGAMAWAALRLPQILEQTAVAQEELDRISAERDAARAETARFLNARPDFREGVKALEQDQPRDALAFLLLARQKSEGDAPNQGAADPEILRYLARAQALSPPDAAQPDVSSATPADALDTMQALSAQTDLTLVDQAWMAAIHCLNNAPEPARAILASGEFVQTARGDPQFLASVPLLISACADHAPNELAALRVRAPARRITASSEGGAAAAETPEAYRIRTIFIQFTRAEDRPKAERLRQRLIEAGYDAPGIELIEGARANVIRYYFDVQQTQAEDILGLVQSILQDLQWGGDVARMRISSLGGRFQNLRRDRLEIWLPPGD